MKNLQKKSKIIIFDEKSSNSVNFFRSSKKIVKKNSAASRPITIVKKNTKNHLKKSALRAEIVV